MESWKFPTLELSEGISLEPIQKFLIQHGPILELAYCPKDDAIMFCLPYHLIPFYRASALYGGPLRLPYRFQSALSVAGELYVLAGEMIYRIIR